MKLILLTVIFSAAACICQAQETPVNNLPQGRYETVIKSSQNKWDKGDIILLNETQYKISPGNDTGEYRFSMTAQRVFFTSGPLKGVFAKTSMTNNAPVIFFPVAENQNLGLRLANADVIAYHKN